jgi:biotin carboxylase
VTRSIFFVGAGVESLPGITLAKSMELTVVASDIDPKAPGLQAADYAVLADAYSAEETLSAVRAVTESTGLKLNGVISLGVDAPLTVASVASFFGLKGVSIQTARLSSDKLLMKEQFQRSQLPIPRFAKAVGGDDIKDYRDLWRRVVVKPVDSRGARGVLKIDSHSEIDPNWAFHYAKGFSPSGRVMVEEFLEGPQVSTESLVVDGVAHTLGLADRNYGDFSRFSPHIIEDGGHLPTQLSSDTRFAILKLIQEAADSIGLANGVIKGDIVVSNGQPHIIEVAARLSGGYFCTHEIPLSTGVNFVGHAIRQALGESINAIDLKARLDCAVAQRYLFPSPGRVRSVSVPSWIGADPDVQLFELRIGVGDIVPEPVHHPSRSGVVITTGKSVEDAIRKAERVIASIDLSIEPVVV